MTFEDLYDDVLLKLASEYVDLRDVVAFSQTCKRTWLLLSSCSFWINATTQLNKLHPLAYPLGYDLHELDLPSLKRLLLRTVSIWQTTERLNEDTIIHHEDIHECKDAEEILLLMPGTNLVLFAQHPDSSERKRLICLDVVTGKEMASCYTEAFWFSSGSNPSRGRYVLGGLVPAGDHNFSLFCLEILHDIECSTVKMRSKTCPLTVPFPPEPLDHIALDGEIIVMGQRERLQLFAQNLISGQVSLIQTDLIIPPIGSFDVRFFNRTLLITVYDSTTSGRYRVYSCPTSFLPYGNRTNGSSVTLNTFSLVSGDHFIHEYHSATPVKLLYKRVMLEEGITLQANVANGGTAEFSCYASPYDTPNSPVVVAKLSSPDPEDSERMFKIRLNLRNFSTILCTQRKYREFFLGGRTDDVRVQLVQFQPLFRTARVREFMIADTRIFDVQSDFAYDESMGYVVVVCKGDISVYRFA